MKQVNTRTDRRGTFFDPLQEFDRLFEGFLAPVARQVSSGFVPPYELQESDQGYLLSFDIPGVPSNNVQIEVKENQLKIAGERQRPEAEGVRMMTERRYGQFERVFTLPADVDAEKIQAHYDAGVLHLMLPKTEKVKAKTIKIETGNSAGAGGFLSKLIGGNKDNSSMQ